MRLETDPAAPASWATLPPLALQGVRAGARLALIDVLHIALTHFAAGLVALWMGFGTSVLSTIFLEFPDGWGFGLPGVYLAWVCVLAALYPACRWFAGQKRRRSDWWLSYL